MINHTKALELWERACATRQQKKSVWIHGDFAVGNFLIKDNRLSGIIDFGCMAVGDPACDLVIAWTYLSGTARKLFISGMDMDINTWIRAKAWALWKSTFELSKIKDKNSSKAILQKRIINSLLNDKIS